MRRFCGGRIRMRRSRRGSGKSGWRRPATLTRTFWIGSATSGFSAGHGPERIKS